jgi:lipoprotein-anchoring transpeptidase ErfK/SrfK
VALADGSTGWVKADDVSVQQVNIVAVGNGTEVDTSGGGGGTVQVFAQPDAAQPMAEIENPHSAEGLNVGPVVFLANGPVDPAAEWINVLLPIRPNGTDGWVRRGDVTLTANQFRIEVHLSNHVINVFDANQRVLHVPIGVGTGDTPTPGGAFYIRSLIASTDPAYGTYAFGLSGFSEVHESFNGGPGDIGIHGTSDPSTVGTDVSNGCIRLENSNIERLAGLLPEAVGPQSDSPAVTTGLGVPVRVLA